MKVLMAEDLESVRIQLSELSDEVGDVELRFVAQDAAPVLETVAAWRPDVAILDVSVRGLMARELLELLKKNWPGMAVVVSAFASHAFYRKVFLDAGADFYFDKSIEWEQLLAFLRARKTIDRLALMVDTAPNAITVHDFDGRFFYANQQTLTLHGYSLEEFMGLDPRQLEVPADQQLVTARLQELRERGEAVFEVAHFCKDGTILPLEVFARVTSWGRREAILSIATDITERKQAEATRARLEAKLRESQKMEALGTLAGGVAHDFNNVLAMIIGNVELARQDVGPGHSALVSLEEIGKASRRARDLVQQILAFGRRQKLERRATSLALVVVETARLLRATLPAMVSLNVDCKSDAPPVLADATQVKQSLLNLCHNALQAVQDQERPGLIEVRLEAYSQGETQEGLPAGRYACLKVRDNGPGMDEATRLRIFEPFFTTKPVGTGLGLSVVHGIVQVHEASIEVESTPGQGSEFRIYFPAIDAPIADVIAPTPRTTRVHGSGKHVLYVDDEEAIIFLMTRLLERQGYRVSGYTDPREALEAARANPDQFDLAVTDYNMPGMSGLEVAQALKEIRFDLPVVLASGYITEELRQKAPAAGVRELIYKPDTVEELCEAVARAAHVQSGKKDSS